MHPNVHGHQDEKPVGRRGMHLPQSQTAIHAEECIQTPRDHETAANQDTQRKEKQRCQENIKFTTVASPSLRYRRIPSPVHDIMADE